MPVNWQQEAGRYKAESETLGAIVAEQRRVIKCLARAVAEFERQAASSVQGEPGVLQAATGLDNRSFESWRAELDKLTAGD